MLYKVKVGEKISCRTYVLFWGLPLQIWDKWSPYLIRVFTDEIDVAVTL